jgi:hypothetical protein
MTEPLPWLEYAGQSTAQILAAKSSHRIDSLLCAMEEGILLRQSKAGKRGTTAVERTFLAVMALDREVNNGGYRQFFSNSTRAYASAIVAALRKIGCDATAALTAKAIDVLALERVSAQAVYRAVLRPDARRDRKLTFYNRQYCQLGEIEPRLFAFAEAHAPQIVLEPVAVPPRRQERGWTKVSLLRTTLQFTPTTDYSLDSIRRLAAELASKERGATAAEIDGATYLYLFERSVLANDFAGCERFAPRAFELAWEDTTHAVVYTWWVERLIAAGQTARADSAAFQYLHRLAGDDLASEFIAKRVRFWARLIGRHGAVLRESDQLMQALLANPNLLHVADTEIIRLPGTRRGR